MSAFHISDVNWAPLSDVMCNGTPNLAMQLNSKALAHVSVPVSVMGIASGHLVSRSTIVKWYRNPCDSGSGPTMSTFMCSKREKRDLKNLLRGSDVGMDLGSLAINALFGPQPYVFTDVVPDKLKRPAVGINRDNSTL